MSIVKKDVNNDLEEIMKKYDKESNVRVFHGTYAKIVMVLLALFSVFAIYLNIFSLLNEQIKRASFTALVVFIIFILYPISKKQLKKVNYIPFYDIIFAFVGSGTFFYYIYNLDRIVKKSGRISRLDIAVGIIGILILLEACRRSVGIPIIVVVVCFLAYAYISDNTVKRIIYNIFYTTGGVIGTPIAVCCTYIVMFIIFGSFLERTGISDFFINSANSIAGSSSGGPAKVAVISSALCGMVSGSSVANTVTTGSITIPMMKETGYKPAFAGAVEAAASTGGQIMPPIMGAAAFLMSEMINVPYSTIVVVAILPAVLYFAGVFIMVHLEAKRLGLTGIPKDKIPNFFEACIKKSYLLLPLVVLIWTIMSGYTMSRAALLATAVAILVSLFDKETRMTKEKALDALFAAAKSTVTVAVACAVAGIIAGVVTMTGLGQILISAIVSISGGKLIIALFFTMLSCIVLGMGLPTTATYVIMATTCAPILVNGMGVNLLSAHMFVFYFGIVADITPPVALAAYAGSAIAGANPMKTGINASKLAIAAFIVPYIFVMSPSMLLVDASILSFITISITAFIGIFSVSIGLVGYYFTKVNIILRIVFVVLGLLMIYPGILTDMIGIIGLISLRFVQYRLMKRI